MAVLSTGGSQVAGPGRRPDLPGLTHCTTIFSLIETLSPGGSRRHVRLSKQANKLHMFGKLTRVTRALAPRLQKLRATAPGRKPIGRSEAEAEQQREAWKF